MADETSPNPMQAHLGLLTSPAGFNPVGIPTPPVRHPGEVSATATQSFQQQAFSTMSTGTRPPIAGMDPFDMSYANRYQANLAQINGRNFDSPFYANMVARMTGASPFNASMMPSPMQFTDPSLGIFRPFPQPPTPVIPPVPPLPLVRHPFVPTPPSPRFQTPYEYAYNFQQIQADQFASAGVGLPGWAARAGTIGAGGWFGGGVGAGLGALVGGPLGAMVGGTLGSLGGLMFAEHSGLGATAQGMVDRINPVRTLMMRGAQMQGMSSDWVVGGASLSPMGMGWSRNASIHAGRLIEDLAYDSSFRNETHRAFSAQDLTRITQTAGQAGLLDFAQSPEAVRDQVKKLATQLRTFMQVANEPDVREALKQLGNMRMMGLSVGESMTVAMNSRMFARMAGTSMRGLAEVAGRPGALMAQQAGLSAGLGYQVGEGMYGHARAAIAGGAYSLQDLAMLGGAQGIAQRNTESLLATLKLPLLAASMSSINASGTWGLNAGNVQKLLGGALNIEGLARLGVGNLHDATAQHGVSGLGMFLMQQGELQDSLGRALGPTGLKFVQMQNVLAAQRTLGFDKTPGGLFMSAKSLGMDDDQAKQFVKEANSPSYFSNMRQQLQVQIRELRAQAQERYDDENGFFRRMAATDGVMFRGAHKWGRAVTGARTAMERVGEFFSEMGEDWGLPSGMYAIRTPHELLARDDDERRQILARAPQLLRRQYVGARSNENFLNLTEGAHAIRISNGALEARDRIFGGHMGEVREYRQRMGGIGAYLGGGVMERFARLGTLGAGWDDHDTIERTLRDFDAGSNLARAATNATWQQLDTMSGKVASNFGIGQKDFERDARVIAVELAKIGNREGDRVSPGSIRGSHYAEALNAAARSGKIPLTRLQQYMQAGATGDAATVVASISRDLMSNTAKQGFMNPSAVDALNIDARNNAIGNALQDFDKNVAATFGESANETTRGLMHSMIGAGDSRAVAAAIALAGADTKLLSPEDADAYTAQFSRQEIADAKTFLAKRSQAEIRELGLAGKRAHDVGVAPNRLAVEMETVINNASGTMAQQMYSRGLDFALGDHKDVVEQIRSGKMDAVQALLSLKGQDVKDEYTRDAIKRAVDAKTAGETQAVADDWVAEVAQRGEGTDREYIGGRDGGKAEAGVRNQIGLSSKLQRELSQNFPAAVDVFKRASDQMLLVAEQMGWNNTAATGAGRDSRWTIK